MTRSKDERLVPSEATPRPYIQEGDLGESASPEEMRERTEAARRKLAEYGWREEFSRVVVDAPRTETARVMWRCAVCRKEDEAGIGAWACHVDLDVTPVHTGSCFENYQKQKYGVIPEAAKDVCAELRRARQKFGKFASAHEGYAVLDEEVDELWDEVKANHPERKERMRAEAIQVAAMAIRFIEDVCDEA